MQRLYSHRGGPSRLGEQVPDPVRVTVGMPAHGTAGFRDSHLQAQRGRRIVELGGRPAPVTSYAEVALVDARRPSGSPGRTPPGA